MLMNKVRQMTIQSGRQ